jgi:diguanylate cyclase (GGDEF)-like protein
MEENMIKLSGFRFEDILYESEQTLFQKAVNTQSRMSVVLKCAKRNKLTPVRRMCFMKDYQISKKIQADCVIQPIDFFDIPEALITVYPDMGCISLNQAIRGRLFQTEEILRLFYLAADSLTHIHSQKWVHMNLSLDHLLFHSDSFKVFIIDWQTAIKMNGPSVLRPPFVNNNPDIIPPERTGFTNDVVDERSDLYALGCIFYELFTNAPVFREKDPLRQIQSHIMRPPVPPHEGYDPYVPVAQHVPESVSQVIMKLLAKNPSQRYDTAYLLKCDLYKCLSETSFISNIDSSEKFPPVIHINNKLYERKEEVDRIHMIYNSFSQQTFDDGISTLLVISGASGTGKSALCNTLVPQVFDHNGYWICDSFSCTPDLPLGSLTRILSQLLKMMHTHFPNELESQIKQLIYKGLICPEFLLELIPELTARTNHFSSSTSSQSQIVSATPFLLALFHMLGQKFQPMIICLKNVQWADNESLMFLETLLTDCHQSFFVVITCNEEQSASIKSLITNCRTKGINLYSVETNNLSRSTINQFILDNFQCSTNRAESLSEIIYEKTDGNPRAVRVAFDFLLMQKKIMKKNTDLSIDFAPTDSLPMFWHSSFYYLNESERDILKQISCIGQSWSMKFASQITGIPALEMERIIQKAFQYGIIAPDLLLNNSYHSKTSNDLWMFSDHGMQQYLYIALPVDKKENVHQKICHHMSQNISKTVINESVYMVASHFDRMKKDHDLKKDQARTYLSAGERALMSGLFLTAYHFCERGIRLFADTDWNRHHQLLYDLYLNAMIAANFASLDKEIPLIAETLSKNMLSDIEKLKYYECLASIYFKKNQHEKVLKTVKMGLSVIGLKINASGIYRQWKILSTGLKYRQFQKSNPEQQIFDRDQKHRLIIRLMILFIRSAYLSDPKTSTAVIANAIHQMLKKGITPDAAYLWIMFARFLINRHGFENIAMHWAHLGNRMLNRVTDTDLQTETRLNYIWYIGHRNTSFNDHLIQIKEEVNRCLMRGYPKRAVQATRYYLFLSLSCGRRLKDILSDLHQIGLHARDDFKKNDIDAMYRQTIYNFMSGITPPHILTGQSFDEQKAIEFYTSTNDRLSLFVLYTIKLMLSVIFRNHEKAVLMAQKCENMMPFALETPMAQVVHFYVVLAYTASYRSVGNGEQKSWKKRIGYHVQQLKKWSDRCPENASHRYYLALAEKANHLDVKGDIAEYYDQSISYAKTNQFYHENAIANELAGAYYAKKEKDKLARSYIMDAYQAYEKWGADRKVAEYARQEKILKSDHTQQPSVWSSTMKNMQPKQASTLSQVDNEDIWQVTQAFCVELKLEVLLENIIQTTLRYSGANKGCLALKKKQSWLIEAHLNMETQEKGVLISERMETSHRICIPIAQKVIQSNAPVCLWDAGKQGEYQYDNYIRENAPRSLLCVPVSFKDNIVGLLYLENKRLTGLFTTERLKRIQIIASQSAIAIKNADFFSLQKKTVQDRATDLNLTVHQLSSAVQDLEARSREMMLLNQFSDTLHGCGTEKESYLVFQSFAQKLFPGDLGILWIGAKNAMKIAASWGAVLPETDTLNKKNCPCIQSKTLLFVEDLGSTPRCQSCGPNNDHVYLCIPLKDQTGEMGVLHFQFGTVRPRIFDDTYTRRLESRRMLICRMTAHYALALANLRLREALKYESRHDPLTGLYNRRHMQVILKEAHEQSIQNNQYLGIVMIDIDHFKKFNDTYGHDTGDAVLKHLGAYLKEKTSRSLQPCRYGGEEFLLMCPNLGPDELYKTAEAVRKGIMDDIKVPYADKLLDVTASLGAAVFPNHGDNMTQVIQNADAALYMSKENGRNQVQLFVNNLFLDDQEK